MKENQQRIRKYNAKKIPFDNSNMKKYIMIDIQYQIIIKIKLIRNKRQDINIIMRKKF